MHNFNDDLRRSHEQADAPWWHQVYRRAFPSLGGMVNVRNDGWAQRGGIDRVLTLTTGLALTVDEKVRYEDYDDIALERWSDRARRTPGWVQKPLACDYIAYAFVKSHRCFLLPTQTLQRAWRHRGPDWIAQAERFDLGYKVVLAQNPGYVTESIAVPIPILMEALGDAMLVTWTDEPSEMAA